MKGEADYFLPGSWNAVCYRCGAKRKAGELKRQWQGYYVCPEHWEPRHPQDFVRSAPDNPSVPWAQDEQWTFGGPAVLLCTVPGKSAIPSLMMPGCSTPGVTKTDIYV